MARFWADILVPVAIVGAVAAQTLGVEITRASRIHAWFPQVVTDTTAIQKDSTSFKDTLQTDSLSEEDFFFGEKKEEPDTTPRIFARDTMRVPDSLRLTDPFLYKWYVAVKDSFTHRLVVDSLKAAGDSLDWPVIDSLYLADSTATVKAAFERWFASLSKSEKKRWVYEHEKLPAILHRQDSIRHRKDSIKNRKDSIVKNTPRILETAFLPDSLYYKRLIAWKHDRMYNNVEVIEWDTTSNYHFNDYPFMREDIGATWLGMTGSAVQTFNYFKRGKEHSPGFFQPYESWTYSAENIPMFNSKTPYTELEYSGNLFNSSSLSSDNFRVFTTQNILPELNIALEMKRYGGAGTLKNEKTVNRSYFITGNWLGKKYLAHGGFIYNKVTRQENGGIQDNMWIRDTTVDAREIEVNMAAATNQFTKRTFFYDQSYRIPFEFLEELRHRGDTNWVKSDSLNTDMPTGFIGTSSEYTVYGKKYVDQTSASLSSFYRDVFNMNPSKSADSLETTYMDNRIFLRIQPWAEDAIVSKVEGGIGDRFQSFYYFKPGNYLTKPQNTVWNSVYAYAGAEGSYRKYLNWDATALLNFAGYEAGDFKAGANASLNLFPFRRHKDSPLTLSGHFETSLKEPEFYQQHFYSNHFAWESSFSKISESKITARLSIPRWRLNAFAGYALLDNNIYYDTLGVARQNTTPMSVISAGLRKDFVFGVIHLENRALLQFSSDQYVLPLPTLALNLRWYGELIIVDPKTMKLQLGINTRYNTLWYAPTYNPVAGVFAAQNEELYGNCPVFDAFVNVQWKKCCLFLKMENFGGGWPMPSHDYFTAHHYIQPVSSLKFGISWPLYPRLGSGKSLSGRAGSGFGGGSGLGGGLSSIKSGLSGALNGN